MKTVLFIGFFSLVFGSAASAQVPVVEQFCSGGWGFPTNSWAQIRAALGEPLREDTQTFPNPHLSGSHITKRSAQFAGGRATVLIVPGSPERLLLQELVVETSTVALVSGLRVGRPLTEFQRVLGKETDTHNNRFSYQCESDAFELEVQDGIVSRVTWTFYTD